MPDASKMPARIWAIDNRVSGAPMWSPEKWPIYDNQAYIRADIADVMAEALRTLVDAKALSGVRDLVAGWNGEGRPEPNKERHPSRLGATLPKTNCGAVCELDDAMQAARSVLSAWEAVATHAADNGATEAELEAIFGWRGGAMASHYTREANRKKLAKGAISKLAWGKARTSTLPPNEVVVASGEKDK